jgi:hypothetical protein
MVVVTVFTGQKLVFREPIWGKNVFLFARYAPSAG